MNTEVKNGYLEVLKNLNLKETLDVLYVSIKLQRMYHQKEGKSVKTYVISSSLRPPSCMMNSFGTPWGLHSVCEVIGLGQPQGMVFKARVPTELCFWESDEHAKQKNLITSRILRLVGLEKGLNKGGQLDTYKRFVYIHGTNHEHKLGSPSSSGCIQVSNPDAILLAEQIPVNTHVFISLE